MGPIGSVEILVGQEPSGCPAEPGLAAIVVAHRHVLLAYRVASVLVLEGGNRLRAAAVAAAAGTGVDPRIFEPR